MVKSRRTASPPTAGEERSRRGAAPRSPLRAFGRSLEDFGELLPAEKMLLECCRLGETAVVGEERPQAEIEANRLRANFVRFLALGGDDRAPVHEQGLNVAGAWITGVLDLDAARVPHRLGLFECRIEEISARQARFNTLNLAGSLVAGDLSADGSQCEGGIFLRFGFQAEGRVRFAGAKIEGNLDCAGGIFKGTPFALMIAGSDISGFVYLRDGFRAAGGVNLIGASIGRDLDCTRGHFESSESDALNCGRAQIKGVMFFREVGGSIGDIQVPAATVGSLLDDIASWTRSEGGVVLDGFVYQRLTNAPTDAASRIEWLNRQRPDHLGEEFKPQPWEQLALVLRSMGHAAEAREIAVAKHKRQRSAGRYVGGSRLWDLLYGGLVGYGYRPWRLLWIAAGVWLSCAAVYSLAIRAPSFGSPVPILASAKSGVDIPCLVERVANRSRAPCPQPPPDYGNFVSLAYSAEVMLPVISLGSKAEWRPVLSKADGAPLYWGWALFLVYWLQIAFGWLAGLLLVSALGNLVKKD